MVEVISWLQDAVRQFSFSDIFSIINNIWSTSRGSILGPLHSFRCWNDLDSIKNKRNVAHPEHVIWLFADFDGNEQTNHANVAAEIKCGPVKTI